VWGPQVQAAEGAGGGTLLHFVAGVLRAACPAAMARLVDGPAPPVAEAAAAGVRGLQRLDASLPRLRALHRAAAGPGGPAGGLRLDGARRVAAAYEAAHLPRFAAAAADVCPAGPWTAPPAPGETERALLTVRPPHPHLHSPSSASSRPPPPPPPPRATPAGERAPAGISCPGP
jgi:hypothetical protein